MTALVPGVHLAVTGVGDGSHPGRTRVPDIEPPGSVGAARSIRLHDAERRSDFRLRQHLGWYDDFEHRLQFQFAVALWAVHNHQSRHRAAHLSEPADIARTGHRAGCRIETHLTRG